MNFSHAVYRALIPHVRDILNDEWAPISFPGFLPPDEYDSYIPRIIGLFLQGSDRTHIAKHLFQQATDDIGQTVEWGHQLVVADRLLEVYAHVCTLQRHGGTMTN